MREIHALGPALGRCAHLARERLDSRLSQYDVTPAQTHVILRLARQGGVMPQCELTDFLKVRPSTANGILDRMVEKGLVTRSVSGSDARRRLITLTDKGRDQQALFQRGLQEAEAMMIRGLTPQEVQNFRSLLDRITQNLEEDRTQC